MKLYSVVGSGNCRKVEATIKHLGLQVDIEYLDFFVGDLTTPAYLSINPTGRVPALVDNDLNLWESNAIMQYLADKVPGNTLFPGDAQARADIVRWQSWELAHFNNALASLTYESVLKPQLMQQEPNQHTVESSMLSLKEHAAVLDNYMDGREYISGNNLTLADYSIINIEGFKDMTPFDWTGYPHLGAYFDRMRAEPHWAATAPTSPEVIGRKPEAA